MNIIPQLNLFEEDIFENLGDLERLQLVLGAIDDGKLIAKLYKMRGKGRNDWPCEAMWNSFIASFLFEHATVESLLRELSRNKQLRTMCGFTPKSVKQKDRSIKIYLAPFTSAYSKFLKNLKQYQKELDEMFEQLVLYMYENLEHFGEILMVDGKAIDSFATRQTKNKTSGERGERDADWSQKQYSASGPNGESVIKTKKWFGFRLHLIADATYELPVAYEVTKASNSEHTETAKLIDKIEKAHMEWLDSCKYFLADKGYDSTNLITRLEDKRIHSIIDIRNCWRDGEETHQYKDTALVYNYKGTVWYVKEDGEKTELINKGYDKSADSLRYGFHPKEHDNRIFRIKCSEDRRIFTPVSRSSYKWKRLYKRRTGVERINGRIDRDYKFEKHSIRGLDKMKMFLSVTFLIYMTMAKIKIEKGQTEHLCKLYA
ncbi:MAG: transposase [Eubacteriales bacterium]